MSKPRGNATSKAHRAERQAKGVKMMNEGMTQTQIASELGVSRMTFWRDLQAIEARYVEGSTEDVRQFKQSQYKALMQIENALAEGTIPAEVANALVRVRSEVAKLLGLNAPERKVVANINAEHSREFLLFKEATASLDEGQMQEVYRFAKSLRRSWTPPAIEADFPKPELTEGQDETE